MSVYLSPGVFTTENDQSVLPAGVGPITPAFIGTAKKGPMNKPVLLTNSQQVLDTFGEPTTDSYLVNALLAFFEEGGQCYATRVGVECEEGQAAELADICIDTSGARQSGWGRLPLFTGIDFGRINLREATTDSPATFHDAAVSNIFYNDVDVSSTDGATSASLQTTGTYTGDTDDSYVLVITSAPDVSSGAPVAGAGFQVIRNSDSEVVAEGTFVDDNDDGISEYVSIGNGLSVRVNVSAGVLDENDVFGFSVQPNNRSFSVSVDGDTPTAYQMPAASYSTVEAFVTAFNAVIGSEDYLMIEYTLADGTVIPQLRTSVAGQMVQISGTNAWAIEVGSQQYAFDIPRSYLIGLDSGPYNITSQNNRVKINVIGSTSTSTAEFNVPVGTQTASSLAAAIDVAGIVAGATLFDSFELTVPGGQTHVVITTTADNRFDTLHMQATYSNLKTLRFAEEINIASPYKRSYRGYSDNRTVLPDAGESDPSIPLSCELDVLGSDCAADTAYFQNIVGWFVAPTPGTWVNDYRVTLGLYTGFGNASGRYKVSVSDANGQVVALIDDVSFDKRADRYISNLVNPGTKYGGTNGNPFLNWEERPSYLDNDSSSASFVVRLPSQFNEKEFIGQADGIPTDPAYSSELDAVVIGNPSLSTGLYAFQNPETYDITLIVTPGFSSGAVIGTALQICESRGDTFYIVDPPFGLRPEQVVDWHNGMLLSDLNTAINSSYGALQWSWIKVFDQFTSSELWVPPSGHVAAIYSRTARVSGSSYAPAGLRRGRILTALDVEYSPGQGERDLLYGSNNAVNPIVKFPNDGIVLYGQRTLQRNQTLLSMVNVRMLLISIKKELTGLLRSFIFEPNDSVLWKQVKSVVDPVLADYQARRALTGYKVVIDETNNTPERIDRNELWVSVFLKPTPAVQFIALNLTVLRTGASFSADEVLAAGGIVTSATSV